MGTRTRRPLLGDDRGFSVIILCVVLALVVLIVTTSVMGASGQLLSRHTVSITQHSEFQDLIAEVGMILADKSLCLADFQNTVVPPTGSTAVTIRYPTNSVVTSASKVLAAAGSHYGRLTVSSVQVFPGAAAGTYRKGWLQINAIAGNGGPGHTFSQTLPFYVQLDGSNKVTSCYSSLLFGLSNSLQDAICQNQGQTYDATNNACI